MNIVQHSHESWFIFHVTHDSWLSLPHADPPRKRPSPEACGFSIGKPSENGDLTNINGYKWGFQWDFGC